MKHLRRKPQSAFGVSLFALALATGFMQPLPALAASVALATAPLATATTTSVNPNVMFVLDDSGSMDWDYMPDDAKNFAGKYGFNSNHCNGVYYDPATTYSPPVDSTGASYANASFSAAWRDGYQISAGTVNLNTAFTGGSGTGSSGAGSYSGPAFYYTYSGTQNSASQMDFRNTNSVFYKECNSAIGSTTALDGTHPVNTIFTKSRLAAVPTTTITVSGSGGTSGATITITTISTKSKISHVTVNGAEILQGTTSKSSNASTVATNIAAGINACTTATTGNCTVTGYSATAAGSVVTIVGPGAGYSPVVTSSSGDVAWTTTAFPSVTATTVNSITVNGTELLSASATGTSTTALASSIASKITAAAGYSATVSSNVVTITGPSTASTYTPVINVTSGSMVLTTLAFPESTPAKLQNFANWYSYYSTRMLMMKTGAGLAFAPVTDKYRVGFLTMNNNVSPGIVEVAPFNAAQKTLWYAKLYASNPGSNTPLREALSHVGQYYAHKFGTVSTYTATITVGGSGSTIVDSITVNGVETMNDSSVASTSTSTVALNIASQINAMQVTDYGAKVSGNVITIFGPASAAGRTPLISNDGGGMLFFSTAFTTTTTTAQLNGITPADPMEYSCQQNFTILSTDGYWNGSTTYDLNNNTVDQQDGPYPRPYNDGAQAQTTVTITYSRNSYSSVNCSPSVSGWKRVQTQPMAGSCTVTVSGTPTGSESCNPSTWNNGSVTFGSCVNSSPAPLPTPNPSAKVETGRVTTPGAIGGTLNTLADVAMYYYQTDLRTPLLGNCTGALGDSVCDNNVSTSTSDNNIQQHMTTFTLGLGARGRMVYSSSYLTDTSGDFYSVNLPQTASSSVCTWQTAGTKCNWPIPSSGAIENIDDLWHAAVNGRGAYFSATNPTSLASGIANALLGIKSKNGAAAAAATSTLNPVSGNNLAFVASYTTSFWTGNLEARGINTVTGVVTLNATWCAEQVKASSPACSTTPVPDPSGNTMAYNCVTPAQTTCPDGKLVQNGSVSDCWVQVALACTGTMNGRILTAGSSDNRAIKTANSSGTALVDFTYATLTATQQGYFNAGLSALDQWSSLTTTQQAAASGSNLVNYLRGQYDHENRSTNPTADNKLYRERTAVLGDALESQPVFIAKPVFSYPYSGYSAYKTAKAARAGTVFLGTNDGMLHAFVAQDDAALSPPEVGGTERWAYVPSMVIPNMWKLANATYSTNHVNFVNGSVVISDVCTLSNCSTAADTDWKTILVGGLSGGGRGYYALDITVPATPVLLWEFTTASDSDLGYSYGRPVITRKADGTWVVLVTSGYNNTSPGTGAGFLYVLNAGTGAIISKISTGVGSTSTITGVCTVAPCPSGLAQIAVWNDEPAGNKAGNVYGGDLFGNLWRFNINDTGTAATIGTGSVLKFATLFSDTAATLPQPIMTTPILGTVATKRVIFVGTGKYLETSDLSNTQVQSLYAIKDDSATTTLVNPRAHTTAPMMIQQTITQNNSVRTGTSNAVDFGVDQGWFVDFPDAGTASPNASERVNIDGKLILGTLIVPTIVPAATVCEPKGHGWLNYFNYADGSPVAGDSANTNVSTRYDATIVGINIIFIGGKPVAEVVTSNDATPSKDDSVPFSGSPGGFTGKRVMWRELTH